MPAEMRGRFLLLYGSQTGQSKAIAEDICERALQLGLHPDLHCLSLTDKKFFVEKERCVVIVTSSTGDGEAPDTALKFVRRLNKKTLPSSHLSSVSYTVLGLGDTNYSNFCANPKNIDRRFQELGAQRFYPSCYADDAVGLELAVDPWLEGFYPALTAFLDKETSPESPIVPHTSDLNHAVADPPAANGVHAPNTAALNGESDRVSSSAPVVVKDKESGIGIEPVGGRDRSEGERTGTDATDSVDVDGSVPGGGSDRVRDDAVVTQGVEESPTFLVMNPPCLVAPSLRVSAGPLAEGALTLPAATPPFISVTYGEPNQDLPGKLAALPWQNNCKPPSAASDILTATVVSARQLTADDAVKKTLVLSLNVQASGVKFRPGDSISVICTNDDVEVSQLIARLGLASVADLPVNLGVLPDTKKRRAAVPAHIPEEGASLRYILKHCVDFRLPPKKALLRSLATCAGEASEQRRLHELCSKEGAGDYSAFLRDGGASLLDVLHTFPSCLPSVNTLLEHLPRLQPRPYSICNCPESCGGRLDIAFNVVDIPPSGSRLYDRRGLCTGWLDQLSEPLRHCGIGDKEGDATPDLTSQLESLSLHNLEVQICARTNQNFRPPSDLSVPLIMIGPGTGVAPFIGFLQERQLRLQEAGEGTEVGETWLLFGNRHKQKDFLFRSTIEAFQKDGVLSKFLSSFSRDESSSEGTPRYVQDNIRLFSSDLHHLIEDQKAVVFVCGDANNMAKDVNAALEEMLVKEQGVSPEEARTYLMTMRIHRRYLEDVWT